MTTCPTCAMSYDRSYEEHTGQDAHRDAVWAATRGAREWQPQNDPDVLAMQEPVSASLTDAWAAAEAALPEYWYIRSLTLSSPYRSPKWEVVATDSKSIRFADGPTPTDALMALASRLGKAPK